MGMTRLLEIVYKKSDRHLFNISKVTLEIQIAQQTDLLLLFFISILTLSPNIDITGLISKITVLGLLKIYHKYFFLLRAIEAVRKKD